MLYKTLKKLVEQQGLTAELREKIDLLYSLGRLTESEYLDLIGGDADAVNETEETEVIKEVIEE